ncbi:MAG: DUF4129 domain-containing protein [Bacteroidota bacterium]
MLNPSPVVVHLSSLFHFIAARLVGFRGLPYLRLLVALLFLSLLLPAPALAQPDSKVVHEDSTKVDLRQFNPAKLKPYQQSDEFLYDRLPIVETHTAWDRFWMWMWSKFFRFLFTKQTAVFWKWGLYLLCAVVVCYVILKLTQTDLRSIFGKKAESAPDYETADENIHELDFDTLIAEAIARQHYSRAVRLFYLQSLKHLTDRHLIDWRINKTNHDYLNELNKNQPNSPMVPTFHHLTSLFEYICYGNFTVSQHDFEEVRGSFLQFYQAVANAKKSA